MKITLKTTSISTEDDDVEGSAPPKPNQGMERLTQQWKARQKETAVNLLNQLFGPHSRNLEKAMDRTSQRAGLLTRNLASVNIPNYRRQDIDFAIEPEGSESSTNKTRIGSLRNVNDSNENSKANVRYDGNTVDVETEVMAIAEMEVRYQLMTEITNRYFSGLKSVIREGR